MKQAGEDRDFVWIRKWWSREWNQKSGRKSVEMREMCSLLRKRTGKWRMYLHTQEKKTWKSSALLVRTRQMTNFAHLGCQTFSSKLVIRQSPCGQLDEAMFTSFYHNSNSTPHGGSNLIFLTNEGLFLSAAILKSAVMGSCWAAEYQMRETPERPGARW